MDFLQKFREYLSYEKQYSALTVKAYMTDLGQFFDYLTEEFAISDRDATHFHVRGWIVTLMRQGLSARTVNRKISSLRTYYKYLTRTGKMAHNPVQKIISPKIGKRLPEVIQQNQLAILFDEIVFPEGYGGMRDRLVLELFYSTGMRNAEMVGLTVANIDLSGGTIKVLGKGNKERLIPLLPSIINHIVDYLDFRQKWFDRMEGDWLILTNTGRKAYPKLIYSIVKKYLTQVASVTQRGPHSLRHSFATHLLDKGADISAIKKLMGHATLASTEVYLHNSIEQLKEVYKKAHPKAKKND